MKEILWFLGFIAAFFFLWVFGGGPERARQNPPTPFLDGSSEFHPAPAQSSSSSNQSRGATSGPIKVTPV